MQQKNKAVLVDVREAKYFNKEHAAGCINVGLFQSVQGRTRLDNLKRLAMAGFAMEATGTAKSTFVPWKTRASRGSTRLWASDSVAWCGLKTFHQRLEGPCNLNP